MIFIQVAKSTSGVHSNQQRWCSRRSQAAIEKCTGIRVLVDNGSRLVRDRCRAYRWQWSEIRQMEIKSVAFKEGVDSAAMVPATASLPPTLVLISLYLFCHYFHLTPKARSILLSPFQSPIIPPRAARQQCHHQSLHTIWSLLYMAALCPFLFLLALGWSQGKSSSSGNLHGR